MDRIIHTLLIGVERLLEEVVAGQDHDDGQVLVDQSQHTVLQLTRHDSLTVQVRDLLDLEGTLQSSGVLRAAAEQQQRLLVLKLLLAHVLDGLVLGEHRLDLA